MQYSTFWKESNTALRYISALSPLHFEPEGTEAEQLEPPHTAQDVLAEELVHSSHRSVRWVLDVLWGEEEKRRKMEE
jgi:hypothetical protein